MRVLPVLDVMAGQVVRGVAGRRSEYRPIVSRLTASTHPTTVARAFRDHFGLSELYLADLDAIAGQPPALATIADLLEDGFCLWVDAGLGHEGETLNLLSGAGVHTLVAGLESLSGAKDLEDMLARFGGRRLVFSLDLQDGKPLGQLESWSRNDAQSIASQAVALGIERLLVLDLAGVGVSAGSMTSHLCGKLRAAFPVLEITSGGGVRNGEDLRTLRDAGVNQVLVASALHDGRLTREDLARASGAP